MKLMVRAFEEKDLPAMTDIWNEVVLGGVSFPQEEPMTEVEAAAFFGEQDRSAVAVDEESGMVLGLYILHPNNIGRCGHIANASYAVRGTCRGQGVGEALVRDCLKEGRNLGFRILQFNAVVRTNAAARHLYEKLGFVPLGMIPGGFRMEDGSYEDICPYYHEL